MNGKKRTIVIGRHSPDLGETSDFDIVESENINFPSTSTECLASLEGVLHEAEGRKADVVLLQAVPGQLAVALRQVQIPQSLRLGIVVSKPGPRPQGEAHKFMFVDPDQSGLAADAVALANPNAKIEWPNGNTLVLTVDPPMKFVFDHIEWVD